MRGVHLLCQKAKLPKISIVVSNGRKTNQRDFPGGAVAGTPCFQRRGRAQSLVSELDPAGMCSCT